MQTPVVLYSMCYINKRGGREYTEEKWKNPLVFPHKHSRQRRFNPRNTFYAKRIEARKSERERDRQKEEEIVEGMRDNCCLPVNVFLFTLLTHSYTNTHTLFSSSSERAKNVN
jgi:hypothetical protein